MDLILYHYNIAFLLKTVCRSNIEKSKWITKGISNSCKRMRVINGLRKQYNLSREMEGYINRYEISYRRVIKEAKRKENDKYVFRANNKTKAMWHVINKVVENLS
jgi:glycyl-tRNA synthetase beta subunit